MTQNSAPIQSAPLSREVRLAIEEGLTSQEEICAHLGISLAYLRSLLNGHRDWSGLALDKLHALADLIGITYHQISVLAWRLPAESLIEQDPDQDLSSVWQAMQRDKLLSSLLTGGKDEWMALPRSARIRELAMWAEILSLRARLAGATGAAPLAQI